jgi:putative ABC transport system permease protein
VLSFVWRELVRNPRRTLASLVGVILGVGLFSGVLFFIDGSGATMTKRAIAPLALDMQRVLDTSLGERLKLAERLSPSGPVRAGQPVTLTLTVTNGAAVPANEVVVNDEPPPPLTYSHGTTRLNRRPLADKLGSSPLAQGAARTGLNIGTVPPHGTATIAYTARSARPLASVAALRPRGTISSRENVVPARANAPPGLTVEQLRARMARIPGVAAVDALAFVDLPPSSLRAGGAVVRDPVRIYAFDQRYLRHYPSIRVVSGAFGTGAAMLSVEAARTLRARTGSRVEMTLPGRRTPLPIAVGAVGDLSRAKPLFYSRKSSKLEDFLYVPNVVVVSPATFTSQVIPAFEAARARRGSNLKSLPLQELDVLVRRTRLHSEPATALRQTKAIAAAVSRIAPGQGYLIDNISNTLQVARDDAKVGKRMFVFLGLPGALLAAFLAAYTGSIIAAAQRREQATLRLRGAHKGHLVPMLIYRTLALAGLGSVVGALVGFLSVLVILGPDTLLETSAGDLIVSALVGIGFGVLTTALALYVPGRRALGREIGQERGELALAPEPAWRRWRIDLALLVVAAVAEVLAFRAGAFDAPAGSVFYGQAVSLPSHLLLAPLVAWFGGMLLLARLLQLGATRFPVPSPPRFGPVIRGTLGRSVRRRSWGLATGALGVGLIVAFGTSLAVFTGTYDGAKAADSKFVVGSDLRVTPTPLSVREHPPSFASRLRAPGVAAASPVVFKLENSVLIGPDNQDRFDLAAIDPATFRRVAPLSDSFFVDRTAAGAMSALGADPRGLLVEESAADDLSIETGDRVRVLLARGTKRQTVRPFRVLGLFTKLPGFPEGVDLIANVRYYESSTAIHRADFFLARASGGGHDGVARAEAAIRSGPARHDQLAIDSRENALDKDQSSLTALNVHGLVDLDSLFTLLMCAAAIGIFVFGLMLQRRREYVTMRAQGMHTRELRALVVAEAGLVGLSGLVAGLVVGTGMAYLLVHVLRPLFILKPGVSFPAGEVATLALLAMAATLLSALAGTAILRRLRPTELLREG